MEDARVCGTSRLPQKEPPPVPAPPPLLREGSRDRLLVRIHAATEPEGAAVSARAAQGHIHAPPDLRVHRTLHGLIAVRHGQRPGKGPGAGHREVGRQHHGGLAGLLRIARPVTGKVVWSGGQRGARQGGQRQRDARQRCLHHRPPLASSLHANGTTLPRGPWGHKPSPSSRVCSPGLEGRRPFHYTATPWGGRGARAGFHPPPPLRSCSRL